MKLKVLILLLCIVAICDAKKDPSVEDWGDSRDLDWGDYGGTGAMAGKGKKSKNKWKVSDDYSEPSAEDYEDYRGDGNYGGTGAMGGKGTKNKNHWKAYDYGDPSAGDSEDYDWGNYYGGTGAKGGTTVNYFGGGTGAKGGMTMKYFGGGMGPRGSVYGPGDYSHQEQCYHHGMKVFDKTCYYLSDFPTTYSRAKSFCEDIEAKLVDIRDVKEYANIRMMLSNRVKDGSMKDGANSVWTDITKKGEKWKLSNKTRTDWADKQPDAEVTANMEKTEISSFGIQKRNSDSEKNTTQCVILKWTKDLPEFMWHSAACHGNVPRYFMCEMRKHEDPTDGEMRMMDDDLEYTPEKKKKNKDKKMKDKRKKKDKKKKKKENDYSY